MGLFGRLSAEDASSLEELLRHARAEVKPPLKLQKDIKQQIQARIGAPSLLTQAVHATHPDRSVARRIWSNISTSIEPLSSLSLWDRLRQAFQPTVAMQDSIRNQMLLRLQPAYAPISVPRPLRWAAAAFLFLFVFRLTPLLFIAPQSMAESPVLVLPTSGEISVLIGGLWQPLDQELTLTQSALLQTDEGEATIVLHDDAVIRMAPHTTIALHDLYDAPQPPKHDPTLTLHRGTVWVQSLIPDALPSLTIAMDDEKVLINEGSASLTLNDLPSVSAWDRRITVARGTETVSLVAGEQVQLRPGVPLFSSTTELSEVDDAWVAANQRKDATRRRELAQLLLERRAAAAGILPTSSLYSVKRVAEAVDVMMTFSPEGRTQKILAQANTRLNEAAALLKEGNPPQASQALKEYHDTLVSIASSTGSGDTALQDMVQREVAEASSDVAAALPDDKLYAVKEAVILMSAALSGSILPEPQETIFVDQVAALKRQVEEGGNLTGAKENYRKLKEQLTGTSAMMAADVQQEALAALQSLAFTLGEDEVVIPAAGSGKPLLSQPVVRQLTKEERLSKVERLFVPVSRFSIRVSRENELRLRLKSIENDPNRGTLLREFEQFLESKDPGLAPIVKEEMEKIRLHIEQR